MSLIVFNGGLMRGQPAHHRLRRATFVQEVRTAPAYRLFSIDDRYPAMFRDEERGASIAAELYELPEASWPEIRDLEPPGLYRGQVKLDDGRVVDVILGHQQFAEANGIEITHHHGWANYLSTLPGPRRASP